MTSTLSRRIGVAVTVLLLLTTMFLPAREARAASVVDPDAVLVRGFEGWGTALAWGANAVGGWSDANRNAIANRLFSQSGGLGLNVVRYHIGGGLNPNWQSVGCGAQRPGSPLPSFQPSPGVWDWTADANQRWFAQQAQARGADTFLAYASSPPWWMTISGCSNGSADGGNNLQGWWGHDGDGTGAYAGTTSYSQSANDSITFRFNGTQIQFFGATSSDSGIAAFSVDGGAETYVDLYSPTRAGNVLLYTSPSLPSGAHTLKMRVTGTKSASSSGVFISPDRVVTFPGGASVDDQTRGTGVNMFDYHWGYYEAFADYLTEVARHSRDSYGVTFDAIDPLNEPESTWWTKTNIQEGTGFDQRGREEILARTAQTLAAKGLTETALAAPDGFSETTTNSMFNQLPAATKSAVSTITTHTYGNSPSDAAALRATADANGKKLWVSEYGTGEVQWGPGLYADPTAVQPAINLAARVVGDMTDLRPTSWILWDGIESWEMNIQENTSWGAIWANYLDPNQTWTVAKQYYGYLNFTRYIRPGARFIGSGDAQSVAAYDPARNRLTIVTYNDSTSSRSVSYDLSRFASAISSATPYRTSATQNFAQLSSVAVSGNQLAVSVPAKSITTYVMNNVTPKVNDNTIGTGLDEFQYSSQWGYYDAQTGAYNLDNHWSGTTNDNYQVRFNGRRVKVYGAKANNHGIAAISIDGGAETLVDLYSATRQDQVLVWTSPLLSSGIHTLKVRVTGTKNPSSTGYYVPADRVDVLPRAQARARRRANR